VRRKLQMPLRRPDRVLLRNLPKARALNTRARIAVAHNIERIESIEAEAHGMVAKEMEVLEDRHIHIMEARPTHRAIRRFAKAILRRRTEGANAIVHTRGRARRR